MAFQVLERVVLPMLRFCVGFVGVIGVIESGKVAGHMLGFSS